MNLFDEKVTIEALLARIEALEAEVYKKERPQRERTECPPEIEQAWREWYFYRQRGKGWTPNAQKINLNKLMEISGGKREESLAIVRQSIERGWSGLFPLKHPLQQKNPQVPEGKPAAPSETPLERTMGFLRQQYALGQITKEEAQQQAAEARRKYAD